MNKTKHILLTSLLCLVSVGNAYAITAKDFFESKNVVYATNPSNTQVINNKPKLNKTTPTYCSNLTKKNKPAKHQTTKIVQNKKVTSNTVSNSILDTQMAQSSQMLETASKIKLQAQLTSANAQKLVDKTQELILAQRDAQDALNVTVNNMAELNKLTNNLQNGQVSTDQDQVIIKDNI